MIVFVLFQTDKHRTRASRVFFGVFTSELRARYEAAMNDLYTANSDVEIIECELDKFGEICG